MYLVTLHHCIQPTFRLGLSKDMHNLYVGRILAQSPDQVTTLGVSDLHLVGWCPVKQLESIFEVCEQKEKTGYSLLSSL